jgi:hypothetical protein
MFVCFHSWQWEVGVYIFFYFFIFFQNCDTENLEKKIPMKKKKKILVEFSLEKIKIL